jgi:putative DNA primase/helicase
VSAALLTAALDYARRQRPIFPVGRDKRPLAARGFKAASTDEARIRAWWGKWPSAGIATPVGPDWFALDVDDPAALAALEAEHGPLPPTTETLTPRPGRHLYLRGEATNSAGALPDGIHVRGTGGYVLLPPSPHENGGVYEWRTAPDETPIAPAPAWLLELLRSPANGAGCGEHRPPAELVPHGQRHPYLCDFAVRLLRAGVTDEDRIAAHLRCEFEFSCAAAPPPRPGYFRSLAKWAARTRIADRERHVGDDAISFLRRWEERHR